MYFQPIPDSLIRKHERRFKREQQRNKIWFFLRSRFCPCKLKDIFEGACDGDPAEVRRTFFRMKQAGEVVSTARGFYTTRNHPCLSKPESYDSQMLRKYAEYIKGVVSTHIHSTLRQPDASQER